MELPPCWRKNLLSLISGSFFAHANNTAPSKPYAKILQHTNNETGWVRIVKKTGEKSHDTVPLRTISPTFLPVDILLLFHFFLVYLPSFLVVSSLRRGGGEKEKSQLRKWVKCGWNIEENEVLLTRLTLTILHNR